MSRMRLAQEGDRKEDPAWVTWAWSLISAFSGMPSSFPPNSDFFCAPSVWAQQMSDCHCSLKEFPIG